MNPYREDKFVLAPGQAWGATWWRRFIVQQKRRHNPVWCRRHGMLQPGVDLLSENLSPYAEGYAYRCPGCQLEQLMKSSGVDFPHRIDLVRAHLTPHNLWVLRKAAKKAKQGKSSPMWWMSMVYVVVVGAMALSLVGMAVRAIVR